MNEGMWRRRTLAPRSDRTAGRSVIDATTAQRTATAAEMPNEVMRGIPATASERSAITTVVPAKTTAVPEELIARAIDSWSSTPPSSCSRCLVTRNNA
jgi:hypothetical protein